MSDPQEALTLTGLDLGVATAVEVLGWHQQKEIWSYDYDGPYPAFVAVEDSTAGNYIQHLHKIGHSSHAWLHWAGWRDIKDAWQVFKAPVFDSFSGRYFFIHGLEQLCPRTSTGKQVSPLWTFIWHLNTPEAILRASLYSVRTTDGYEGTH